HPISGSDAVRPKPTHMASLYGADRPGQVATVAARLAALNVNISGLSTRLEGQASIQELELTVPEGVDIRAELTDIAHARGIRLRSLAGSYCFVAVNQSPGGCCSER